MAQVEAGFQRHPGPRHRLWARWVPDVPATRLVCETVAPRISAEAREIQGMAGAKVAFRILHSRRRTALNSRRRRHPQIRDPAHERDAELSAGEMPETYEKSRCRCRRGMVRARRNGGRRVGMTCSPSTGPTTWRELGIDWASYESSSEVSVLGFARPEWIPSLLLREHEGATAA